ncbi:hypothetical protein MRS76_21500 [Rhizobiaceae bacterium n13]|uniref:Uncharacterized protein n=1 Tax=Ferirhizobium litorale TaxID=2927786 RepID=A0AAE3QF07_9HYPH|nr:hypothetical protein [Fererhizobium litorale]MDI7864515.1 hypothetical protein [Fererhizobium litorale]MDI7923905.1 hypothetical protein [Fererhizobium litorale]
MAKTSGKAGAAVRNGHYGMADTERSADVREMFVRTIYAYKHRTLAQEEHVAERYQSPERPQR